MDVPKPPDEVKNIIDKLANFVARNGAEFEKMTKEKQKGNPKFQFLFGGEHYAYYQFKLSTEQQIQNQQKAKLNAQVTAQEAMVQHSLQNAPWQQNNQQQQPIPPLMPQFPRFPPNMRMPMPNAPPWQQQSPMRFMPPNAGQNMRQPPPNMSMPSNQQMSGPPPPQNFNMQYRQPPPNMPSSRPSRFSQQPPPDQSQSTPDQIQNQDPQKEIKQETEDTKQKEEKDSEEEKIAQAEKDAKKKIDESSNNLKQQYEVLMQQQQEKIEAAITQAQEDKLSNLAANTGIETKEFDVVLQPIINTCTKDSISGGKSWILNHSKTAQHCEVITRHLLKKILEAEKMSDTETVNGKTKFDTQLHIVYLVNDVLHHASRKHLSDLSSALQSVILPIFCMANANAPEARKERLTKLLGLWQKFKYFNEDILEKLKDPPAALSEYQANLIIEHAAAVQKVQSDIQNQYKQYEEQHKQYAAHIENQVKERRAAFERRKEEENRAKEVEDRNTQSQDYNQNQYEDEQWTGGMDEYENNALMQFDYGHGSSNQATQVIDYSHSRNPSEWQEEEFGPRLPWGGPRGGPRMGGPWQDGAPWGGGGGMRPRGPRPRGPPQVNPNDPGLMPKVPYYDLPAGLMCPLVKLEEMEYKTLDPALIRLPPPLPPSERLLAAVEAFYGPPSHERPRNVDGWERNGLFEFYRAKVRAKRRKEGNMSRSKSKSKSRSRSRSRSRSKSRGRSYSRSSSSRSRSRSRSRSSRSRSRSRSRSKNRSRSPDKRLRSISRSRSRSPDKRRTRSRSPVTGRAPTPPLGGDMFSPAPVSMEGKLGEENRGAQMLKRMGWGGAGLGAKEQGRENPITAGEVRDKYDQFKGLGMPTDDPYESFRKSKSQGFITRIKARDRERGTPRRNRRDEDKR